MPKNRNIEPTTKAIKTVTARNGKIARLPRFVRGQLGRKPAKYIIQVENGVPGAQLELTGDEEIEKPEAEPGQGESKSVKPPRKRRTVQKARKTKPGKVANPLKANDVEGGKEEESSQAQ